MGVGLRRLELDFKRSMPKDPGGPIDIHRHHRLATCSYTLHTESLHLEILHHIVSRNRTGLVEVWPAKIVCQAILLAGSLWKVELRLRQTGLLLRELEDPEREEKTESNQITVAMPAIAKDIGPDEMMKGFKRIKDFPFFVAPGSKEGCGAKRGLRCCQGFKE